MSAKTNYLESFYESEYFQRLSLSNPASPYQTHEPGTITSYRPYEPETISAGSTLGFEAIVSELNEIWDNVEDIDVPMAEQTKYETTTPMIYSNTDIELRDSWLNDIEEVQHSSTGLMYEGRHLEEEFKAIALSLLETTFAEVAEFIDWDVSQTSESIKEAIDLALANGYHTMAANLAAQGHTLFPEDAELQKFAKILAPPTMIQTDIAPAEGLRQSMKWLKENRQHYQGEWVAVQNGVLVGHAPSRPELTEMLTGVDPSRVIITRIPESFELIA